MNPSDGVDDKTVIYTGASSPAARLVCLDTMLDESLNELDIRLGVQDETLGRGENNSIAIRYNKLSRNHAHIRFEGNKWIIEDLKSANGTYINEQKIVRSAMGQGDIVVIGQIPFRFEVINTAEGKQPPAAPEQDYVGDAGTMYAQHIGVIEQLAGSIEDNDEQLEDLPPPPSNKSPKKTHEPAANHRASRQKKSGWMKYLVLLFLIGAGVGGYFFWKTETANNKVDDLAHRLGKNLQYFLERYEIENSRTPLKELDLELSDLRKISKHVQSAVSSNPEHGGLQKVQQKAIFLTFERQFLKLLRDDAFYDADKLIKDTRLALESIIIKNPKERQNFSGLLDLADTTIRFRRFSDQYPEPSPTANKTPDDFDLRKMLEVKTQFIDRKKENYLLLSVTYTRLYQMLEKTEEKDIRLLNRWQDIIKRKQ